MPPILRDVSQYFELFFVMAVLFLVVVIVVPVVAVARRVRRVRRANRIVPTRATDAPLWWLWAPTPAASLHRRLRSATAAARFALAGCGPEPIQPLASAQRELESVAMMLDDGVVAAARLPRAARWRALRDLSIEIGIVEDTAEHVVATASRFASDTSGSPAQRMALVHEQLSAVDAAVEEVRQIEATRLR